MGIMARTWRLLACGFLAVLVVTACGSRPARAQATAQSSPASTPEFAPAIWRFAVSGDSRNCGNVVMPAIAEGVRKSRADFYWHLGDFRKIYDFDEDMQHEPEHRGKPMSIIDYENAAWNDFIKYQLAPFGTMPVFLGIGNHETIPPKTREEYIAQFGEWLASPTLQRQRQRDDPPDRRLRTYFHWAERGVDFIYLDNATPDQFDRAQVNWFEKVLADAVRDPSVTDIVVGMHQALPDSLAADHSMSASPNGEVSGRRVYQDLLKAQGEGRKRVFVLASHSHFYMDGVYNTDYWRNHGGVLPGWIVGTAGAVRYPLPADAAQARAAKTNVYGFLLATVNPGRGNDGGIRFDFVELQESDVPPTVVNRFTPEFVHWCFTQNREGTH
jgi:hypothetical protein